MDTADRLRGFGPIGLVAILGVFLAGNVFVAGFMIPLGALLVLAWAHLSQTPLAEIGYARPRSWLYTILAGVALGVALKFAMKALVMPLLGADPINRSFQYLAGNVELVPAALWTMLVVGFAEETVFRGFLFERLGRLFGQGRGAKAAILLITSVLFAVAHYGNQGLPGVQQAFFVGLGYGGMYLVTRTLWLPIVAHSTFDLVAYAMIFWGWEADVATAIFP